MTNTTGMNASNAKIQIPVTITAVGRTQVLPGRPLYTIATLISAAALFLTTLAGAALVFTGALPPDQAQLAAHITPYLGVAGASSLGLGALAKGIYALATALDRGQVLPVFDDGEGAGEDRVSTPD